MSFAESLEDLVMEKPVANPRSTVLVSLQLPLLFLHNEVSIYDHELAEREILPHLVGQVFPELSDSPTTQEDMVNRLALIGMPSEYAAQLLQRGLEFVVDAITEHLPSLPADANASMSGYRTKRRVRIVEFSMHGRENVKLILESSSM